MHVLEGCHLFCLVMLTTYSFERNAFRSFVETTTAAAIWFYSSSIFEEFFIMAFCRLTKPTANKDEFANLRYYLKYLLLHCSMK